VLRNVTFRSSSSDGRTDGNVANMPLKILAQCEELHTRIQPLNDRVRGPLEKSSHKTTALPFVLLLGNHSSGKSSFINYVLERPIQTSGVAPTDDSFTIIAPGKQDVDQDGPALVGDPDVGFSGLRQFGPPLVHHMRLKIRKGTAAPNFMIVDSPGMIDSPVRSTSSFETRGGSGGAYSDNQFAFDRGYDFEGTVRWFAERADVILLFFDPDKPGTTGETLSIMTNSLAGMDHKLHIVLNKADQFKKIHDFARAYGSLCWNLSKVIPRKDLPRIHTMCLPVPGAKEGMESSDGSLGQSGLADLHETRDEVVAEVRKAPKRRVDNMITRLVDSVNLLQMHATVLEQARAEYSSQLWRGRAQTSGVTLGGGSIVAGLYQFVPLTPPEMLAGVGGATLLATGLSAWLSSQALADKENKLLSAEGLNHIFQSTYASQISEGDAFVASVWHRIRDRLQQNLKGSGLGSIASVSASELSDLQSILDDDVPKLRRMAAPLDYTEMVREGYQK